MFLERDSEEARVGEFRRAVQERERAGMSREDAALDALRDDGDVTGHVVSLVVSQAEHLNETYWLAYRKAGKVFGEQAMALFCFQFVQKSHCPSDILHHVAQSVHGDMCAGYIIHHDGCLNETLEWYAFHPNVAVRRMVMQSKRCPPHLAELIELT